MPDISPPEGDLIQAHMAAKKVLRQTQTWATIIPLGLLLLGIGYVWWRISHFMRHGVGQTVQLVMKQAPEVIQPTLGELGATAGRLVPLYRQAIADAYVRDMPIYRNLVESQTQALQDYSTQMRANLNARLQKLMGKILTKVELKLAPTLTTTQREEFEQAAALALYHRLQSELQAWQPHQILAQKISQNIYNMALNTPQADDKTPAYMIGAGLELIGLELQEASQ